MTKHREPSSDPTPQRLLQEAIAHHQAGRLAEAERLYRAVLQAQPQHPDAHHNLGMLAVQTKRVTEGVPHFKAALDANPDHPPYWVSYLAALIEAGQLDAARAVLTQGRQRGLRGEALDTLADHLENPSPEDFNTLVSLFHQGRFREGETLARGLAERFPRNGAIWKMLGAMLKMQGRSVEALAPMEKAIELLPADAEAHNNLAVTLKDQGRLADAAACYRRALQMLAEHQGSDEGLVTLQVGLASVLNMAVPGWHIPMINHALRNEAYQEALRAAITPETRVLEIGTGSGLLAMMAARLGARQVVTCEAAPLIAATARQIVADNGLASSIRVVAKRSTQLQVGEDLPQQADLLVSEIFGSELLGEGALASFADAKRRLLVPGARIIPAAGSIVCALFGGEAIRINSRVDDVCGFDLRRFNTIVAQKQLCYRNDLVIDLLTDEAEAFAFDFSRQDDFPAESRTLRLPVRKAGRCYGIVQWIRLQMDDRLIFENHPAAPEAASSWQQVIYPFPAPIDLVPGQTAVVKAAHNRNSVWFFFRELE